ncbi:retrotransposable element Tf2 [Tanacetum coccineum]
MVKHWIRKCDVCQRNKSDLSAYPGLLQPFLNEFGKRSLWISLIHCLCHKLPLAEYWYNTNFHSSINNTPYEVVYGQPPPLHIPYVAKYNNVEAVDRTPHAREQTIQLLKFNLKKALDRMKSQADKRRSEREFKEGDWCDAEGLIAATPFKLLERRMAKQENRVVVFGLI